MTGRLSLAFPALRPVRRRNPVHWTVLVALLFIAGLLAGVVVVLDQQAAQTNVERASTQLAAATRSAADIVTRMQGELAERADRIAASPRLDHAIATTDPEELQAVVRPAGSGASVRMGNVSVGALPRQPRLASTVLVTGDGNATARVTVAERLTSKAIASIDRQTTRPADSEVWLLSGGRAIGRAGDTAYLRLASDRIRIGSQTFLESSAHLPGSGAELVVAEPLPSVSAGTRDFRKRALLAALLTLISAAAFVLPLARPLSRFVGDLRHRADSDALTGLANRRMLEERLGEEIARAQRHNAHLALVLVDIDNFKRINDRYGHQSGDEVLQVVSATLAGSLREADLAARFGGEEFALVLPGTKVEGAHQVAENIRRAIAQTDVPGPNGERVDVTASFGIAGFPTCQTMRDLIRIADEHLYQAKRDGRNRVVAAVSQSALRL
ncbi:MAG TPA: GGDEF domain-containing protein [Gaiellaceae bacterium]|nr:GGDEF domain-containing protein [Gaiellaceae bacterium]